MVLVKIAAGCGLDVGRIGLTAHSDAVSFAEASLRYADPMAAAHSGTHAVATPEVPSDATAALVLALQRDCVERSGRHVDGCSDTHWVMEAAQGEGHPAVRLRPVQGWYEFEAPSVAQASAAVGLTGGSCAAPSKAAMPPRKKKRLEDVEAEIRLESNLRKLFAERWEAMLVRRGCPRSEAVFAKGQILWSMRRKFGAAAQAAATSGKEVEGLEAEEDKLLQQIAALAPIEAVKTLELMEGMPPNWLSLADSADLPAGQAPQIGLAVQAGRTLGVAKQAFSDSAWLKDDTGIDRQRRKLLKALKRKADAIARAEDEEVPHTANALLMLKSERGEGLWDFAADEEFSDDEVEENLLPEAKEKEGTFGEERRKGMDEAQKDLDYDAGCAPLPANDEGEEVEEGDQLTGYGQEIEALLQRMDGAEDADKAVGPPARTPNGTTANGTTASIASISTTGGSTPSTSLNASPTSDADVDVATLQKKAVDCLRYWGGCCTLSQVAHALGLTKRGSATWNSAISVLREVASQRHLKPLDTKAVLLLRESYWGADSGPPLAGEPHHLRWWYLDSAGSKTRSRETAQRWPAIGTRVPAGIAPDPLFRVCILRSASASFGPSEGGECKAWLPASRAPATSPEY
eukprot:TRINITY_DN728_c0_g1_i4.p1 TRINITY_DN728_c0_g1~~TRINITY_DN728_c0_g1_i4.p1  ORF type:complete len:632 (-),score=134.28 TRINITY_DN728_c0_g1_i4:210-2105(-)